MDPRVSEETKLLSLEFANRVKPRLVKTDFRHPRLRGRRPCITAHDFPWTRGPKALAVLLIKVREWGLNMSDNKGPCNFVGCSERTLYETLRKVEMIPTWAKEIFGDGSRAPLITQIFGVSDAEPLGAVEWSVDVLPPGNIQVRWDGQEITNDIETLDCLRETMMLAYFSGDLPSASGIDSKESDSDPHSFIDSWEWVAIISSEIDRHESNATNNYWDLSSKKPRRILNKLADLIDLDQVLKQDEREVLAAAAFVRVLRTEPFCHLEPNWKLFGKFEKEIKQIIALLEKDLDTQEPLVPPRQVRCLFIAVLLRLGEILDMDHSAIHKSASNPPNSGAPISEWIGYFTTYIEIKSRGMIVFHLVVPSSEWREPLKCCTALEVEFFWQQQRRIFTRNNVSITVAPSDLKLRDDITPPESVRRRLKQRGDGLLRQWRQAKIIDHLGSTGPPEHVEDLLPLPESSVVGRLAFRTQNDLPQKLDISETNGQSIRSIAFAIQAGNTDTFIVPLPDSPEATTYYWTLFREYDKDAVLRVASGSVRNLDATERRIWKFWGNRLGGRDRSFLQIELNLRGDFLAWLWPSLKDGSAELEEKLIARRFVYSAYEWIRLNPDYSRRLSKELTSR